MFNLLSFVLYYQYKCRAILDAMRRAYIPWSPDMEALVKEGLALDHPR